MKRKEDRENGDFVAQRGSQTFEPRRIERSTMTDEPDSIEFGCDAYDFQIAAEIQTEQKSKLELLRMKFFIFINK